MPDTPTTQPTDVEAVFLRMAELQDGNAQPSTIDLINDLATLIRQQQAEIERLRKPLSPDLCLRLALMTYEAGRQDFPKPWDERTAGEALYAALSKEAGRGG
jgi:hypothetical protein